MPQRVSALPEERRARGQGGITLLFPKPAFVLLRHTSQIRPGPPHPGVCRGLEDSAVGKQGSHLGCGRVLNIAPMRQDLANMVGRAWNLELRAMSRGRGRGACEDATRTSPRFLSSLQLGVWESFLEKAESDLGCGRLIG